MGITRTAMTDDSGLGTDGTIFNNAWKTTFYDELDGRWSELTTTSTGTQNNVVITSASIEADVFRCNNATDLTITGIVAPASPAKPGKKLIIRSVGAGHVYLAHQNASSTAANRLINFATSGNTPLAAGSGMALLEYDDTTDRWCLVAHEQGAWITPTFAAGDFTANGAQTWTVASGDRLDMRHRLRGRTLSVSFYIATTTVGGTPNTQLLIGNGQWGGFSARSVASSDMRNPIHVIDNGTRSIGIAKTGAATSVTAIACSLANDASNWAAATDTTYVIGQHTFEVQ